MTSSYRSSARSIFYALTYCVAVLMLYAWASYHLECQIEPLTARCTMFEAKRVVVQQQIDRISQQIAAYSDPSADEYALITQLGKIPVNSHKIILQPSRP